MSRIYEGAKFGRLTALKDTGKKRGTNHIWLCRCDCGNYCEVATDHLGKATNSCGCLKSDSHATHRESRTRLYIIWCNMKKRCDRQKDPQYKNYGGRGITYCEPWKHYEPFKEWAMKSGYDDKLSLDRIDVNGNYEPDNCRWATASQQMNNRRVYGKVPYHGVVKNGDSYLSQVTVNGKRVHCCTSKDLMKAVIKRDEYILSHNLPHKLNVLQREKSM